MVTPLAAGTTTITVSAAEDSDHTATPETQLQVTVHDMSEYSTTDIASLVRSGQAKNVWYTGLVFPMHLSGTVGSCDTTGDYGARILGFNHNPTIESNNTLHLSFPANKERGLAFQDPYDNGRGDGKTSFCMNQSSTATNTGGWKGSHMYQTIMPQFVNVLPTEWRNIMKAVPKYRDNVGGGTDTPANVTSTTDKVFLLAEYEAFGKRTYANSAEQNYQLQYDMFKNGRSKKKHKYNTPSALWWFGSVEACVYWRDEADCLYENNAKFSYGVAPYFAVA